ncbi:hypothetical protein VU11_01895 [Desulfobulbus sp. US2]|uniref:Uncharacterized protein n=1 Tax=Candidatus Electrothrix communis TaxID=1859133 RepID=A0A3S3QWT7_9BACT|nr:hypothetical protein [Desulfobulbus sp. US4]MCW5205152.1 hypothetical protein [Desulfobulbus sp. N2]MCW5207424.1 hypothetical protein [Desulfobulbus sp. US2]MCW5210222.1 hypothetical protein [Desulfobulbus sp. N3]RWX49785.1 hypothetical protein VT98_10096 [Candidatus Electrothrix communis]
MYLHITILAATILYFSILPFSAAHALAEHIDTQTDGNYCTIPLPDPEELSEDEKEWFTTFQEGTFYVQGWKEITTGILEKIQQERKKEEIQRSLNHLGIRIGCEWSKKNDVRKIDTDMLEQWGSELQKAAEDNPNKLPIVIANIQQKVFELVE